MPYKFETDKLRIPKDKDRRRKLTDGQRAEIKNLYGTISQRKLAEMFNVSRRLIQFIGCPDKKAKDLENRAKRGGSKIYYNKNKHTVAMREHRKYKKQLNESTELV